MKVSQWLSSRNSFSDWNTDRRTEAGSKVSLQYQHQNTSEHPLPMGVQLFCVGLFPLGIKLFRQSRMPANEFISVDRFTSWPQDETFSIYDNSPALGYFVPGQRTVPRSRFYDSDAAEQDLFDFLATEDGRPIVTEDTNEGLGLG